MELQLVIYGIKFQMSDMTDKLELQEMRRNEKSLIEQIWAALGIVLREKRKRRLHCGRDQVLLSLDHPPTWLSQQTRMQTNKR